MNRDQSRKVLISHFLPYGFIGANALITAIRTAPISGVIYDPDMPMTTRRDKCEQIRRNNMVRIGRMERGYYITYGYRKFGTAQVDQFGFYSLTRSGLYLLTGTKDTETEKERVERSYDLQRPYDKKNNDLVNYTPPAFQREIAAAIADYLSLTDPTEQDRETFEKLFFHAVSEWLLTPLSSYMIEARNTSLNLAEVNGLTHYRMWRISNINAMFYAAGFLSMLDRRPLDQKWTFNGVCPEHPHNRAAETIPALTQNATRYWYKKNPDIYLFHEPKKTLETNREEWKTTPTFYGLHEIDGFELDVFKDIDYTVSGQKNAIRHTALGVGIGKKTNYILYHTKPKKMRWNSGIERYTARQIQDALDSYSLNEPVFGSGRVIQNALIFCDTIFQFAAIFDENIKPKKYISRPTLSFGTPFRSMNIILLNGAGVHQLAGLMNSTPVEYNRDLARRLKTMNSQFMDTGDWVYPLALNNMPVFLAYDLDYFQLCKAIEDWRLGKRFYVACYPEQVTFLQKILPNANYL